MTSTKTDQLTVNEPTADTDTSHPINQSALFPWTSLSQEEILDEIQKGMKNLTGPNKDSLKLLLPSAINTKIEEETIAKIPIDKAGEGKRLRGRCRVIAALLVCGSHGCQLDNVRAHTCQAEYL